MNYETVNPRKILGEALSEAADSDSSIVVMSTDSGINSGFTDFINKHPERYFEMGIMEQTAIGTASGLATTGKKAIYCCAAAFAIGRPYEMLKDDAGYMQQNVKVIGRNTGLSYSYLGPTHYALEDIALARLVPEMLLLAPCFASEIKNAFHAMLAHDGPVYMRLSDRPAPALFDDRPFTVGKGYVISEGTDVTVIAAGNMMLTAMLAKEILAQKGVSVMIVGMPTINPLDKELIISAANKTKRVVTVEEHFTVGGLGSAVAEVCAENALGPVKRIGVPQEYIPSGPYDDLIKYCGLDADSVAKKILEFSKQK